MTASGACCDNTTAAGHSRTRREVRILAALGGSDRVVDRFRALAATLNAGLIDRAGLTYSQHPTARHLRRGECEPRLDPGPLAPGGWPSLALSWRDSNGSQWLAWAFSARLDGNLSRRSLPGPGLCTMTAVRQAFELGVRPRDPLARRDAGGVLGSSQRSPWDCCPWRVESTDVCLSNTDVPCLRTVAVASDPSATTPGCAQGAGPIQRQRRFGLGGLAPQDPGPRASRSGAGLRNAISWVQAAGAPEPQRVTVAAAPHGKELALASQGARRHERGHAGLRVERVAQ